MNTGDQGPPPPVSGEAQDCDPSSPPAQAGTNQTDELAAAQQKNRELGEKLKETHERMLRSAADLDNYRKRALKEKEELQKFAAERLIKDFLPILDNLERALEHAKTGQDFGSLREGVAMTRKVFEDTLTRYGVSSVVSVGQPFDPRLHEALQHVETSEVAPNHVVSEVLKGYLLNHRLIRPALVVVAKEPKDLSDSSEQPEAAQIPPSESTEPASKVTDCT